MLNLLWQEIAGSCLANQNDQTSQNGISELLLPLALEVEGFLVDCP